MRLELKAYNSFTIRALRQLWSNGTELAKSRTVMNPIKFECPQCHEINAGDESSYGRRVKCRKCQAEMLVPQAPASTGPQIARLIPEAVAPAPLVPDEPAAETDIFKLSPVARAFPGQILLGVILIGLGIGLAILARDFSWPAWVALVPFALGVLVLLLLWLRVKSCSYRLTTQRLFVNRGWLATHVDELELYRVKDVAVDQGFLQRLLGYGTITVSSDDESTPETDLVRISRPLAVKEMIRTQYRAARQREGVRPTEFMP
jgi:membrane protein YdbS with pleckstrin-like domain